MRAAAPTRGARTTVRSIDEKTYWDYLGASPHAGYQQSPQWGRARSREWHPELVGWYRQDGTLTGVALIRTRDLPLLHRSFAIVPQGPVLDWEHGDLPELLEALRAYARTRHIFTLVVVPRCPCAVGARRPSRPRSPSRGRPSGRRSHRPRTLAAARAGPGPTGWHHLPQGGVPTHPAAVQCVDPAARRTEQVLAGMTRAWRKNIRKAERDGVVVVKGTREDLPAVQRLYTETAERQGFETHPLEYFEAMWDALAGEQPGRFHLHLALHDGDLLAANGTAQAGGHAQGIFAANGSLKRRIKASNAVYAEIIRQARADGADDLDIGGVAESLEADGPEAGLLLFKADMGGEVREYVGGWELVLSPLLHAVFTRLLSLYSRARHLTDRVPRTIRGRKWW